MAQTVNLKGTQMNFPKNDTIHMNATASILQLVSGMFTGVTSRSAVAPFERLIVLKQTNNEMQYKSQTQPSSTFDHQFWTSSKHLSTGEHSRLVQRKRNKLPAHSSLYRNRILHVRGKQIRSKQAFWRSSQEHSVDSSET